ncbi:MAG TPA: hypothetical protein PLE32_10205 [Haliscomenobacter sp.]|nr:hypothetical protein [Haliscomenobacter sp.]
MAFWGAIPFYSQAQLNDYLDQEYLKTGGLLIVEHKKEKSWRQEWMRVLG